MLNQEVTLQRKKQWIWVVLFKLFDQILDKMLNVDKVQSCTGCSESNYVESLESLVLEESRVIFHSGAELLPKFYRQLVVRLSDKSEERGVELRFVRHEQNAASENLSDVQEMV